MLFDAADDACHAPTQGDTWFTETSWFSFNVPERRMGCWLYAWARRNMTNAGGSVFVWDPSATAPWNLSYCKYQYTQPLRQGADLRELIFPENYRVRVLDPLRRYHLTYADRDLIRINAIFEALQPAHGFSKGEPAFMDSAHFDQMGHITGTMILDGETIPIDSYSIRDRCWGTRLDHRGSRIGYPFAGAKDIAFCLFTVANKDFPTPTNRSITASSGGTDRQSSSPRAACARSSATRNKTGPSACA